MISDVLINLSYRKNLIRQKSKYSQVSYVSIICHSIWLTFDIYPKYIHINIHTYIHTKVPAIAKGLYISGTLHWRCSWTI